MKTVVIIGSNGQLGTDLVKVFAARDWNVISLSHSDIEITQIESVAKVFKEIKFDWVVNTAAFHKVDECEKDTEKAWLVNAKGQQNVTRVANELHAKSVYISSDYVFNGEKGSAYTTHDPVSPINAYGHSKAGGEFATLSPNSGNVVMRVSSLFGTAGSSGKGGNFIETIIEKARLGEEMTVVDDIQMSPTYTVHAAKLLEVTLNKDFFGLLHGSNAGVTSWYDFASYILRACGLESKISRIKTNWEVSPKRPKYSALDTSQNHELFGEIEIWESAINLYLIEKGYV